MPYDEVLGAAQVTGLAIQIFLSHRVPVTGTNSFRESLREPERDILKELSQASCPLNAVISIKKQRKGPNRKKVRFDHGQTEGHLH